MDHKHSIEKKYSTENLTITQVCRIYNVTPRMLRYYEKLGLIKPQHQKDYAYRTYDKETLKLLQQIILLRKLRLNLKQISVILQDREQQESLQLLQNQMVELDQELASLNLIRRLIKQFADRLATSVQQQIHFNLLEDSVMVKLSDTLCLSKTQLKENTSMEDLNKAEEILDQSLNVRFLILPPYTVAAYHYIGKNPEENAGEIMTHFVQESKLYEKKPDARMFGFNHPNPGILENGLYGYEVWVTIPLYMEVDEPIIKKHFPGGLYAALSIPFPEFHLWKNLTQWISKNKEFEPNYSELGKEIMNGCLEEHLNWIYAAHNGWKEDNLPGQIDLLLPIRHRCQPV